MCLAVIAAARSARFPWVLASNRDEWFHRAAAPMDWWRPKADGPALLGGRDLSAGGTWLGLTAAGRLAFVTNVREPGRHIDAAPSRGDLVPRWLGDDDEAGALHAMAQVPRNGFNFVAADLQRGSALWLTNRPQPQQRALGAGLHGVSNAALDTPWPKLLQLKHRLADALDAAQDLGALRAAAFAALADRRPAPDAEMPSTGLPRDRERGLSPAFIRIEGEAGVYGTRCSTLVIVERVGDLQRVHMTERRFGADGAIDGETRQQFELPAPG